MHIKLNKYITNALGERVYEDPLDIIMGALSGVQMEKDAENHCVIVRSPGSASYFKIYSTVYGYGETGNYAKNYIEYYDSTGRKVATQGTTNNNIPDGQCCLDVIPTKDGILFGIYQSRFFEELDAHGYAIHGFISSKYNVCVYGSQSIAVDNKTRAVIDKTISVITTTLEAVQVAPLYGDDEEGFMDGLYVALVQPPTQRNTVFTASVGGRNFYLIGNQNNAAFGMLAVEA